LKTASSHKPFCRDSVLWHNAYLVKTTGMKTKFEQHNFNMVTVDGLPKQLPITDHGIYQGETTPVCRMSQAELVPLRHISKKLTKSLHPTSGNKTLQRTNDVGRCISFTKSRWFRTIFIKSATDRRPARQ